jgi:hypothetical protein
MFGWQMRKRAIIFNVLVHERKKLGYEECMIKRFGFIYSLRRERGQEYAIEFANI